MIQPNPEMRLRTKDLEQIEERLNERDKICDLVDPREMKGHLFGIFARAQGRISSINLPELESTPKTVAIMCRSEAINLLWLAEQLDAKAEKRERTPE